MSMLRAWARDMYWLSLLKPVWSQQGETSNTDMIIGLLNAHELTAHRKTEELHCTVAWCFLGLQAKNISTVSGQVSNLKFICPGPIIKDSDLMNSKAGGKDKLATPPILRAVMFPSPRLHRVRGLSSWDQPCADKWYRRWAAACIHWRYRLLIPGRRCVAYCWEDCLTDDFLKSY